MPAHPRPARATALGLALGATLLAASGAIAGTPAMGANGSLGLPCFSIAANGSTPVDVTQKRAGSTIASGSFVPATDGTTLCLKPLKAGDKLVITQGATTRTATVPALTLALDLARNKVTGTSSLTGAFVSIEVLERVGGLITGVAASRLAAVGANGAFSTLTTPEIDAQRGDQASANILTATDEWSRVVSTGALLVQVGSASVTGTVPVGARATAVLTSPAGAVRGRFSVGSGRDKQTAGRLTGTFRRGGKAVKVRAGDLVTFSGISTPFRVLRRTLVVDTSGNGSLSATCPAGGEWIAYVDTLRVAKGDTPKSGKVAVGDLAGLTSGEHVKLVCSTKTGFATLQESVVP
ncbi:MAG: hypothetical protein U0869_00710 [Chloroflexota bacterium]